MSKQNLGLYLTALLGAAAMVVSACAADSDPGAGAEAASGSNQTTSVIAPPEDEQPAAPGAGIDPAAVEEQQETGSPSSESGHGTDPSSPADSRGLPAGSYRYSSRTHDGVAWHGPSTLDLEVGPFDETRGEQRLSWVDASGLGRVEVYRWTHDGVWLATWSRSDGDSCAWDPPHRWVRFPLSDREGWVVESTCRTANGDVVGTWEGPVERLADEVIDVRGHPTDTIVLRREDVPFTGPQLERRTTITDWLRKRDMVLMKRVREHHQSGETIESRTSRVVEELQTEP